MTKSPWAGGSKAVPMDPYLLAFMATDQFMDLMLKHGDEIAVGDRPRAVLLALDTLTFNVLTALEIPEDLLAQFLVRHTLNVAHALNVSLPEPPARSRKRP